MTLKLKLIVALMNVALILPSHLVAKGRWPWPNNGGDAIIDICKVIRDPSRYADKTIRLKAVLLENRAPRVDGGDTYLYGPDCRRSSFHVVVEFSSEEGYQPVAVLKPDVNGNVRSDVILLGVFHYSDGRKYGHLDWAEAKFVVQKVERAKSTMAKIPWQD
jgi:hypothetical protein